MALFYYNIIIIIIIWNTCSHTAKLILITKGTLLKLKLFHMALPGSIELMLVTDFK